MTSFFCGLTAQKPRGLLMLTQDDDLARDVNMISYVAVSVVICSALDVLEEFKHIVFGIVILESNNDIF